MSATMPPATIRPPTAARHGLLSCHVCGRLAPESRDDAHPRCPRCAARLHRRKPDSLNRTWALLLTAVILYIPANLLPIMTVIRLGRGEPNTILQGVRALIEAHMWPLALLIFFASVLVPLVKIATLAFLLISVQKGMTWRPRDRTLLFRITESFGHWSMVDLFIVAILAALVDMEAFATIRPGPGATWFGAVVVTTMLAARSFDPRLIWDAGERHD